MKYIAERKLLFSNKNENSKSELIIRISEPFVIGEGDVTFPVDGVTSGCRIELDGMDEPDFVLYGMDSLQAINLASNTDPLIERLSKKYDFYWVTGEPYF